MAQPELSEAAMKFVGELEMEMMVDMYNRMTVACQKKCIPTKYKDPELSKGEAVCIDRCVAKYLEVHDRIGKKLTALSQQDEATMKKMQQQMQAQQAP